MKTTVLSMLTLCAIAMAPAAMAQTPQQKKDGNGAKPERRYERLTKTLGLSEAQVKELKEVMAARINQGGEEQFHIYVVSFGFKYGLPLDADLVMDVRFLPNPFYDDQLRRLTGLDQEVRDYVMSKEVSRVFFQKYSELLIYLVPKYIAEGKSNLVVAIGCTGGQHRSVTLAEMLHCSLAKAGILSSVRHRDVFRKKEEA